MRKLALLTILTSVVGTAPAYASHNGVLHVSYVGVATTYLFGLESQLQSNRTTPPPSLEAVFGTYQARVSWQMDAAIPVALTPIIGSRYYSIGQRHPAGWTTASSNGRVSVDGLVGCPFGSACPTQNSPGQQPPCTTDALSMDQPWAKSLNGGRLDIFRGGRIQLHLPLDTNAVVTPAHNPCADFTGGTSNIGPIGFAPPDGTRAPAPSRAQLLRYQEALAPATRSAIQLSLPRASTTPTRSR